MKNKRFLLIICSVILILLAISSVNAGIFEFVEDNDDESDDSDYLVDDDSEDDNDDLDLVDDDSEDDGEDYEVKKFKLKIPDVLESVVYAAYELELDMDYEIFDDSETIYWLEEFQDHVIFATEEGNFLLVNESEADIIPISDKYSYCIVECKVIDTHFSKNEWGACYYYLVKDIDVIKKIKKESKPKVNEYSLSSTSSDSSSSYVSSDSSSSSDTQSPTYIGNSNSGKFHYASCRDVEKMNPGNKVNFYSREDAVNNGYVPCGHCHP